MFGGRIRLFMSHQKSLAVLRWFKKSKQIHFYGEYESPTTIVVFQTFARNILLVSVIFC